MAESMHRAQQSRGRCWGPFSVLSATASSTGLDLSPEAWWNRLNSRVYSSGRCWWGFSERRIQKTHLKKNLKLYGSWFLETIVANARASDLLMDLAVWNFPGVYHCLLIIENSLGAVASTGQARSQTLLCSHLETTREVREAKILVTEKWVLNKSFWIRRKCDITGSNN